MELPFVKLHGNGNDFILIDEWEGVRIPDEMKGEFAAAYCDRRMGVGGDGILFLGRTRENLPAMRLFQPDQSEAEIFLDAPITRAQLEELIREPVMQTVAMIKALSTAIGEPLSKGDLAELACLIEIEQMAMPIGKQDQYAAAYGGLNEITFTASGCQVKPLEVSWETRQQLQDNLMLFFTGHSRNSADILREQLDGAARTEEELDGGRAAVVEGGDHHVSLVDGDRFEVIHRFASRYALHGGPKFTPDGRFVFFGSRDGWITKYDLWNLTVVAEAVSYTHLRAHETVLDLVCRLLLEKKKTHQHLIYPRILHTSPPYTQT